MSNGDFEFIDDGFKVEVKFNCSLVNNPEGVSFEFTNDSDLVVKPVCGLGFNFNVDVNFNIGDDSESVVDPVGSSVFDFDFSVDFDIMDGN